MTFTLQTHHCFLFGSRVHTRTPIVIVIVIWRRMDWQELAVVFRGFIHCTRNSAETRQSLWHGTVIKSKCQQNRFLNSDVTLSLPKSLYCWCLFFVGFVLDERFRDPKTFILRTNVRVLNVRRGEKLGVPAGCHMVSYRRGRSTLPRTSFVVLRAEEGFMNLGAARVQFRVV